MNLEQAIARTINMFKGAGQKVHTKSWQAMDISKQPAGEMVELLHYSMVANLEGYTDPCVYQEMIKPNLPWAEDHFKERVCGFPINPGTEWANWPWANKAQESLNADGIFNHNYMERYWPKMAGVILTGTETSEEFQYLVQARDEADLPLEAYAPVGIRGQKYGNLDNLISLMLKEPDTRQAYLPVWFPEDTGDQNPGRKPCTLGYHFIMRNNKLDVTYYIRSCDIYRHFRDDVYLTARLLVLILETLQLMNPADWNDVKPGHFIMHITSLHCFVNDYRAMFGRSPE